MPLRWYVTYYTYIYVYEFYRHKYHITYLGTMDSTAFSCTEWPLCNNKNIDQIWSEC